MGHPEIVPGARLWTPRNETLKGLRNTSSLPTTRQLTPLDSGAVSDMQCFSNKADFAGLIQGPLM
jgi:hypothetical protein